MPVFRHFSYCRRDAAAKVLIPMKKIAHSELMTIRSSPSDAVKNIVEQVIVMGQELTVGIRQH
jgi:hypothetical protein